MWDASTYLSLIKNDSDSTGPKKHQDRQTKGHYKVLQGALQSPQCVSVDAVGFWGASEKGLPALGWEKGHELHLSEDAGETHSFRRLIRTLARSLV